MKIYTACGVTPSTMCKSSYLIRVGPGPPAKCFWQRERQIAEGSRMTLQPWQESPGRSITDWERGGGVGWGETSWGEVCVSAEHVWWWGMGRGKVNKGHSSGLSRVLPSGWKRKWLGLDLTPDEMFHSDWLSARPNVPYSGHGLFRKSLDSISVDKFVRFRWFTMLHTQIWSISLSSEKTGDG